MTCRPKHSTDPTTRMLNNELALRQDVDDEVAAMSLPQQNNPSLLFVAPIYFPTICGSYFLPCCLWFLFLNTC